ncbi:MAG: GNAT family N-acetyltransferase [Marmoricola sp.]
MLRTDRLRLEPMTAAEAADTVAGRRHPEWHPDYPRVDDVDAARSIRPDGGSTRWGSRRIMRASDGLVVGTIGYFGPPAPAGDGVAETEVGYGLVAAARGAGLATEALRALAGEADRAGVRLRASVGPDNAASLRVLAKCGFTEVRGAAEGGEMVLARPVRA